MHLNADGVIMDARFVGINVPSAAPIRTLATPDTSNWLLFGEANDTTVAGKMLHMDSSGEWTDLLSFQGAGPFSAANSEDAVYVGFNEGTFNGVEQTLKIIKLDLDGNVTAQREFVGDSTSVRFESMDHVPDLGIVLAGRTTQQPYALVIMVLDSALDVVWSRIGPDVEQHDNYPVVLQAMPDSGFMLATSSSMPSVPGRLLAMSAIGGVDQTFAHQVSNLRDVKPLTGGEWLFLDGFPWFPGRVTHYSEEGEVVNYGSTSGMFQSTLWPALEPSHWYVLGGAADGDMHMARFNLEDGSCLPSPYVPSPLVANTASFSSIQFHEVEEPMTISDGTWFTQPLPFTRNVHCGSVGIESPEVSSLRTCKQLSGTEAGPVVEVQWGREEIPEVQLFDAMGRQLPTNEFQWETQDEDVRLLHLPNTPGSGIGIVRVNGKQVSIGCKLSFGLQ